MIRIQLTCDCCHYAMRTGDTGEPAHRIRFRLRAEGWHRVNIRWRDDPNGRGDLCPKCWAERSSSPPPPSR